MKKIISYSLFGDNPKYLVGAVENARTAKEFYPDFTTRFYVGKSVPEETVGALKNEGAEVFLEDDLEGLIGTIWRFYAFADEDVEIVLIRDVDSRFSMREVTAVNEWLESGKNFHIMRDHPQHGRLILAGMWGARAAVLRDIKERLARFSFTGIFDDEQLFLERWVYDLAKKDSCIHASFRRYEPHAKAFSIKRDDDVFGVGEPFDANGNFAAGYRKPIYEREKNKIMHILREFRYKVQYYYKEFLRKKKIRADKKRLGISGK